MNDQHSAAVIEAIPAPCVHCGKAPALCICESIVPLDNKISLLILQHPQEQDRELGTAGVTARHFTDAILKIGLSWPSLAKILGRPIDPQRWIVLYLGSVKPSALAPQRQVIVVNRKGEAEPDQDAALRHIEGVILLDGTWSQAKALWWRNPWMLRCRRAVLAPAQPSAYGKLRREPRREGLSTIEAAAMVLARLEQRPEIETALKDSFARMLTRYRETGAGRAETRPPHRRRTRR